MIGNHNLKTKTGRFTILKTPEDLRLNSVVNEMHVLFHCDLFDDLRTLRLFPRHFLFESTPLGETHHLRISDKVPDC